MLRGFCAIVFAVVVWFATPAQADPGRFVRLNAAESSTLIIPVGGCHRGERTHFVPEVNRTLPHVHIGEDCEPYRISDSGGGGDDDEDDEDEDDDEDDDDGPDFSFDNDDDDGPEVCMNLGGIEVCN